MRQVERNHAAEYIEGLVVVAIYLARRLGGHVVANRTGRDRDASNFFLFEMAPV